VVARNVVQHRADVLHEPDAVVDAGLPFAGELRGPAIGGAASSTTETDTHLQRHLKRLIAS
jgi:hypothetical protein